ADDRVRATAHARLAGVGLRARVAVVARGVVGGGRIRAQPRPRVAGARDVTLVGRVADDRVRATADTRLAGVGLRAGVAVVARGVVRLLEVCRTRAARDGTLLVGVTLVGGLPADRARGHEDAAARAA